MKTAAMTRRKSGNVPGSGMAIFRAWPGLETVLR